MGGSKEKKERQRREASAQMFAQEASASALANMQGRDDEISAELGQARVQGAESRGRTVGSIDTTRNRDYNTFMNPDISSAREGYTNFANTGGITDADRQNIRARASAGVSGYFDRARNEANRAAVVQGGYGPARSAVQSRLARENAAALYGANLGAEGVITDRTQQGRMFGTSGLADLGNQTAGRNLQRDATVIAADQNLLGSDRAMMSDLTKTRLGQTQMYYDTLQKAPAALTGGVQPQQGRDWLGTIVGLGGLGLQAWDTYKNRGSGGGSGGTSYGGSYGGGYLGY